jgi:hypothetical protein
MDGQSGFLSVSMLASASVVWAIAYAWVKWLNRPQHRAPEQDQRMDRMEQAIETIALEVERIGEGQRYMTRVLAEHDRVAAAITRPPAEHRPLITPH